MIEFETKLKRWGRSFGIVVPMEKVREIDIKDNETVSVIMNRKKNPLRKHFGTFKFKRLIKEILKEGDKESWDE